MKTDTVMYESVHQILKNKIESGLLPPGTKLPSRAKLCREFNTSEKTVRRAVELLVQEGLVTSTQRMRPVVAYNCTIPHEEAVRTLHKADTAVANDILRTGILLCYPINRRGMQLCTGEDWNIPETIVNQMDPDRPTEFWRLSNRLWRFFISRLGNDLILRAVDSLGFGDVDPLPGTLALRGNYLKALKRLITTMKQGGQPERISFEDLNMLYCVVPDKQASIAYYEVSINSPFLDGADSLEQSLSKAQERYSSVYLDLLGLIAIGRYQPGDRLPSHEELQKIYNVSVDTTVKAIATLQEWGVVTARRGAGIFVAMDLDALKKIKIRPEQIASHVRRFLDSLELLSLTVEGVAAHSAENVTPGEALQLYERLETLRSGPYVHQLFPRTLLEFIISHIQYDALRAIYGVLLKNYSIGRSIPKLVSRERTPESDSIYRQIFFHCGQLGYLKAAMAVYDGDKLWK